MLGGLSLMWTLKVLIIVVQKFIPMQDCLRDLPHATPEVQLKKERDLKKSM